MHFEGRRYNARGIYICICFLRRKSNPLRKQLLNYCQNTVGGNITSAGDINATIHNSLYSDFSSTYCKVQRDGQELCGMTTNQNANKRRKWCRWSQSSTLPVPVSLHYHPDVKAELSWLKPSCPMARLECIEKDGSSVLSLKGDVLSHALSVFHHAVPLQPSAFLFSSWKLSSPFLPKLKYLSTCWGLDFLLPTGHYQIYVSIISPSRMTR